MDEQNKTSTEVKGESKLSLPIAIVVAGALIAGAIYLSNGSGTQTAGVANNVPSAPSGIEVKPISASDHFLGNPEAPVTYIEFSDLECPYCKKFHETANALIDEFGRKGQVAWVYRHFPLVQLHSKAAKEAEAVECVNELSNGTATFNYIKRIFEITPANNGLDPAELTNTAVQLGINKTKFNECVVSGKHTARVQADLEDAVKAGGRGTPFLVVLLKKEITKTQKEAITAQLEALGPGASELLTVDKGGKILSLSGALPLTFMQEFTKTLIN
jgi:protein-disulfide isomerase